MYHPLAMDLVRIQQDELRRRADAYGWQHETIESRPHRHWWPRPHRSLLRLAFTDTAMRRMPMACVDC